jgi:hypothetical protein
MLTLLLSSQGFCNSPCYELEVIQVSWYPICLNSLSVVDSTPSLPRSKRNLSIGGFTWLNLGRKTGSSKGQSLESPYVSILLIAFPSEC